MELSTKHLLYSHIESLPLHPLPHLAKRDGMQLLTPSNRDRGDILETPLFMSFLAVAANFECLWGANRAQL